MASNGKLWRLTYIARSDRWNGDKLGYQERIVKHFATEADANGYLARECDEGSQLGAKIEYDTARAKRNHASKVRHAVYDSLGMVRTRSGRYE